jgi:hypothetical protein
MAKRSEIDCQSDRILIANQLENKSIANTLQSDCKTNYEPITNQSQNGCKAVIYDCEAIIEKLHGDYKAMARLSN